MAGMDRAQLEQEIMSLRTVLDMRCAEISEQRRLNGDLHARLERHYWLEKELDKTRQRVEEMNLVVQNKMVAEKELMEMTESLTDDLASAREEILGLRREIENRRYLTDKMRHEEHEANLNNSNNRKHNNNNSSSSKDPSMVLDVREKTESVAWMLHIPDSPKLTK